MSVAVTVSIAGSGSAQEILTVADGSAIMEYVQGATAGDRTLSLVVQLAGVLVVVPTVDFVPIGATEQVNLPLSTLPTANAVVPLVKPSGKAEVLESVASASQEAALNCTAARTEPLIAPVPTVKVPQKAIP